MADQEKQMAARASTSLTDMEMIRRLSRLEKFELQQQLKAKIKPKLVNNATDSATANLFQDETTGMDLNEMAKHLTIKVIISFAYPSIFLIVKHYLVRTTILFFKVFIRANFF